MNAVVVERKLDAATGLRGRLLLNESMRRHTTWRAGGPADRVYLPADLADLAVFLRSLPPEVPVHWVGLGSNLLVRDGGLRGTVVLTHPALKRMAIENRRAGMPWQEHARDDGEIVYAEAGVASPRLARFCANHNLIGAEFFAGIPGTVGGALAMNAGCYGSETWSFAVQVLTLSRDGQLVERLPVEFDVGYRHVAPAARDREEWFVAAWFRFRRGDGEAARDRISELLKSRAASQPLGTPNAGSVFRNPPGDHAARLIESCGLKGRSVGGARVSEKHANFIVNTGDASAADIESLVALVEEAVGKKTGIRLVREVRIVGEPK